MHFWCPFSHHTHQAQTSNRVEAGKPVERLEQFDPQVAQIIMVPLVVGG